VDGQLVGRTFNQVYSKPERWQVQLEPSVAGEAQRWLSAGHVYVKWVWIGTFGS
jgi:hypothetical protein